MKGEIMNLKLRFKNKATLVALASSKFADESNYGGKSRL